MISEKNSNKSFYVVQQLKNPPTRSIHHFIRSMDYILNVVRLTCLVNIQKLKIAKLIRHRILELKISCNLSIFNLFELEISCILSMLMNDRNNFKQRRLLFYIWLFRKHPSELYNACSDVDQWCIKSSLWSSTTSSCAHNFIKVINCQSVFKSTKTLSST